MWGKVISFLLIPFTYACAQDIPNALAETDKPDFISLSSNALPNGLELNIVHSRDWMISEPGSQADYSFLIYSFSKNGKKFADARTYIDEAHKVSLYLEDGSSFSDMNVQNSIKTLYALGFSEINRLGDDGYRSLNKTEIKFDWPDVENWAYELNKVGAK